MRRAHMAAAQRAKYRRILQRLDARPGQRVLEIGCGWGGFAETAAREAGLEVVGLTLSPAQLEFARQRMQLAGLEQQVSIELRDYRDLAGEQFDHIVSIEMFEAVGERWWPAYFATMQRLLAPAGRAVVQSITIRNELFARYRRGTDFIQQHIFPGGMLPSPSVFAIGQPVRDWHCATLSLSAVTMRGRSVNGRPTSSSSGRRSQRWVSTNASADCGDSIWRTARPDSTAAAPT
jgi:cyclopropane fatty-acyl-phospholipid synthase-like methyltransferase